MAFERYTLAVITCSQRDWILGAFIGIDVGMACMAEIIGWVAEWYRLSFFGFLFFSLALHLGLWFMFIVDMMCGYLHDFTCVFEAY